MNIALIYGGKSGEHEISLVSATSIARNIDSAKHNVVLIAITKDGRWFLQDSSELNRIKNDTKATLSIKEDKSNIVSIIPGAKNHSFIANGKDLCIDVAFPALHGPFGEDGTIQGLFEMADIPYVGCGVMAGSITMDKEKTKVIWQNAGLPVVPYVCIKRSDLKDTKSYNDKINNAIKNLGLPLFVKPCSAGSSDGANKASTIDELNTAITEAFKWDDKILIEKSINAREVECSVTGNSTTDNGSEKSESVTSYIPGEIAPTHEFYDYDAKYNDPEGAKLLIPAALTPDELENVRDLAIKAYSALDASGLSRVDFFIDRDTNKLYLNEINTLPGFTSISMFPKMCEKAGLQFTELTELLLTEAVCRFNATRNLQTSR